MASGGQLRGEGEAWGRVGEVAWRSMTEARTCTFPGIGCMDAHAYAGVGYAYASDSQPSDAHAKSPIGGAVVQDYGFRLYSPSIGRFLSVDPLTSSYPMLTPYQFASNRPIDAIDVDGLEGLHYLLTLDHVVEIPGETEPWRRYVPFANRPAMSITGMSITDLDVMEDQEFNIKAKLRVPVFNTHRPNSVYYHEYEYVGTDLEGLGDISNYRRHSETPTADAFVSGFEAGVMTGVATGADPIFDAIVAKTLSIASSRLSATTLARLQLLRNGLYKTNPFTKQFKRKWSSNGTDYEVRVHAASPDAPVGSNSASGTTVRVARRSVDSNGKSTGWEYADGKGGWHSQSTLRSHNRDGTENPLYNAEAANDTHIPIEKVFNE